MRTPDSVRDYLTIDTPGPPPEQLEALRQPVDPALAMPLSEIHRLLDPAPLPAENGWCWTAENIGYVAVCTPMPGNTAEMWDWWFDWHPRDPLRYRIWCPEAHFGTSFEPAAGRPVKPFWGATHYPDEDVGVGREIIRIEFLAPSGYGFSSDALDDPHVGTIVGGYVGSPRRHTRIGIMSHVFLSEPNGLRLRSRFWIGSSLRPDAFGPVADILERALNRPAVRRRVLPAALPGALAVHCATEYTRLAVLLPELYARYA